MNRRLLTATAAILLMLFVWVMLSLDRPHPDDIDGQVRAVAESLRCPQCQWLSAWQSNSESALLMREEIRQMVSRGMTRDEIVNHYVERYGESILLMPPLRGAGSLAYLLPLAVLIGGIWWLRRYLAVAINSRQGDPQ